MKPRARVLLTIYWLWLTGFNRFHSLAKCWYITTEQSCGFLVQSTNHHALSTLDTFHSTSKSARWFSAVGHTRPMKSNSNGTTGVRPNAITLRPSATPHWLATSNPECGTSWKHRGRFTLMAKEKIGRPTSLTITPCDVKQCKLDWLSCCTLHSCMLPVCFSIKGESICRSVSFLWETCFCC